jgi:cardiolipin synthase
MNIALRYVKGTKTQPWRDTMLRMTGPGVYALQRAFLIDWYFVDRTLLNDNKYYPPVTTHPSPVTLHQIVTSSPVEPYPEIMQGFVRIIMAAKRYVYIETPYFMPTDSVLFALKTAAVAGIDVRILVPKENDAWFADWAGRSYLREMVEAGVKVNLYTAGFLHSKLMVCDDNISTCGSTNVDFRSFENNFEANAFIYSEEVAQRLKQVFLDDETQSVTLSSLPKRIKPKFLTRLFESLIRMLAPLM